MAELQGDSCTLGRRRHRRVARAPDSRRQRRRLRQRRLVGRVLLWLVVGACGFASAGAALWFAVPVWAQASPALCRFAGRLAVARRGGADWTTYGGGLGADFANPRAGISAANAGRLCLAWRFVADGEVSGNPVVAGGRVYFGTWSGTVYALDERSGAVVWRRRLLAGNAPADRAAAQIRGGPLYNRGHLFVATGNGVGGRVVCLDPADGRVVWRSRPLLDGLPDALRAAPRAYDGVLYESLGGTNDAPAERGGVVALDERTGRLLWRTTLVRYKGGGTAVFGPPVILPRLGELVVGTGNPTPLHATPPGADPYSDSLVALSLKTGQVVWSHQTLAHDTFGRDFIAAPNVVTLPDGRAAVGDGEKNGTYYLFNAATGQRIWAPSLVQPGLETLILATSSVSGGRIFVGAMDVKPGPWPVHYQPPARGLLFALDEHSGSILWSRSLPSVVAAAPVSGRGVLFVLESNGTLLGLDAATRKVLWRAQTGGQVWNAEAGLTLAGRTLVVPLAHPGSVVAYTVP